jgi:hypothetical protein
MHSNFEVKDAVAQWYAFIEFCFAPWSFWYMNDYRD